MKERFIEREIIDNRNTLSNL